MAKLVRDDEMRAAHAGKAPAIWLRVGSIAGNFDEKTS